MTTTFNNVYAINGVISTDKTVLQNMISLANAAGAWITVDNTTGKFSININRAGSAVANFNDSNIIGGINISETGINELYNTATVEFPHATLRDQTDFVSISIDPQLRFPNEVDNTLNIQYDCINSPVQASLLANLELRQSRVNRVIQFRTDFTKLGLSAGDIISITNAQYQFVTKPFRITQIEEDDSDGLILAITALEYSDDIYTQEGVVYTERKKNTGILIQEQNEVIRDLNDQDWTSSFIRMLGATAATSLLNLAFQRNPLTGKIQQILSPKAGIKDQILSSMSTFKPVVTATPSSVCEGATVVVTAQVCVPPCSDPAGLKLNYTITGVQDNDISIPLTGEITLDASGLGELSIPIIVDSLNEGVESMKIKVEDTEVTVSIREKLGYTYETTAAPTSVTAGASSTVTLTTTNVPNGTTIPYEITGATSAVSTALTGTVTVNANVATLTVETVANTEYQGTKTVTVTFDEDKIDLCNELDKTAVISIEDNIPEPPAPPADKTCEFVSVPLIWCGNYDGTTGQLKSATAKESVFLAKAFPGEATVTVPIGITVTPGNPSTIAITSTAEVAAVSGLAGIPVQIITSFNSVAANRAITGTTQTFNGYF